MRHNYLLAMGLLTGLAIPASTFPPLSNILPVNSSYLWNSKHHSLLTVDQKNPTSIDTLLPEFRYQVLQNIKNSHSKLSEKTIPSVDISSENSPLIVEANNVSSLDESLPAISEPGFLAPIESLFNRSSQSPNLPLTSGYQLYYQRLAALKTGQIYTRRYDDSPSFAESNKQRQLTYEDWKSLLALEAKAVTKGQGNNHLSIMVGDSLSLWFPPEKLPSGKLWLNQGISGDTSSGILKRLTAFSATRPEIIYIMAGINDLRKGVKDETILQNHRQIIRRLRKEHPKTQIIVQSILPTNLPTISNSRIRRLNFQLSLIVKQEGANYLNIHDWFTDFEGNLRLELTTDGLHLSQEGYDVWRSALEQVEYRLTQREYDRLRSQF
ncbi:SGNH/GDSL hydrolase family protein [Nostoc sp. PCC 7107]|uniref:SGNH/GDSL hydrolase family protein n=1 Tax=Nostoc sp. PCC 7107 TaxID=317936 RepID=UPI00029F3F79|nr:SGNH/GDSL hydrolase family protein [Nostoc sp. PCC 7107]AFY43166.1 lipolytic protein G-D-S-L family [Nostoc sp. PCC 7107]